MYVIRYSVNKESRHIKFLFLYSCQKYIIIFFFYKLTVYNINSFIDIADMFHKDQWPDSYEIRASNIFL